MVGTDGLFCEAPLSSPIVCPLPGTSVGLNLQPTPLAAAAAGHRPLGPSSLPHQTCPNDPSWCLEVLWDNCEGVLGIPIALHWPKDSRDGLSACCTLELQCVLQTLASPLHLRFTFPSRGGIEGLSDSIPHHSHGTLLLSALCVIYGTLMMPFLIGVITVGLVLLLDTLSHTLATSNR